MLNKAVLKKVLKDMVVLKYLLQGSGTGLKSCRYGNGKAWDESFCAGVWNQGLVDFPQWFQPPC